MAAFNPFYSEETGHIPLDELAPWQQALMNPGANNPGMSMPAYDQNLMSMLGNQSAGVNPGAGTGGSMMPSDPYTWTGSQNSGAGNAAFNNVFNTGTTPRNTPTIASPALLANNMSMQGAENVGGMGMYTGSNGPLDTNRFTPVQGQQQNGPPPGSIPTGDPNTWITPWGATYTTPGSINNSSSAAYDVYRQRAFGDMMGPMGRGPNTNPYAELSDVLRQVPGSINAQTFLGYLGSLQGQQTGPYPPPQTAPLPPRPPRGQAAPQSENFPGYNPQALPGAFPVGDPRATWGGMYDAQYGQGAYARMQQQEAQKQDQMLASVGMRRAKRGDAGYNASGTMFLDLQLDPLGMGMDQRGIVMLDGSPVNWQQVTQQYGANKFGGNKVFQPQQQPSYGQNPYQMGQQTPVIGSPETMPFGNQRGTAPPGYYQQVLNGNGQMQVDPAQMAAQFSSDPASQQAYIRDMFGGGQQGGQQYQSPQNVDFRAATFGGGSIFPAASSGGSGSNIPNTTNPVNTQYSTPQAGWGGATNRRGGFGGMGLFGNQFGSGGSTGFGGTQSSQYRGAGSYGRPASYGQSQRPY